MTAPSRQSMTLGFKDYSVNRPDNLGPGRVNSRRCWKTHPIGVVGTKWELRRSPNPGGAPTRADYFAERKRCAHQNCSVPATRPKASNPASIGLRLLTLPGRR
jgi:hypothetical protein